MLLILLGTEEYLLGDDTGFDGDTEMTDEGEPKYRQHQPPTRRATVINEPDGFETEDEKLDADAKDD